MASSPLFRRAPMLLLPVLAAAATPAAARDKDEAPARPAQIQKLYDCRTLADAAQRLACFDREAAALEAAEAAREISFADRASIKKARRGLFGFTLPKIDLFGGDDDADEIKSLETKLKSASMDRSGKYRLVMEDDAVWVQIDTTALPRQPKPGQNVLIKKATMGSYFVSVDGQRSIRMRRER